MTHSPISDDPHPLLVAALETLDMTIESEMSLFRQHQALEELPQDSDGSFGEPDEPQLLTEAISSEEPLTVEPAPQPSIPSLELEDVAEDLTPSELALFQVDTETTAEPEPSETNLEQQEAVLEPSSRFQHSADVAGAPLPSETAATDPHVSKLDPAIQDYLDSSTALRQHLEDAAAEPQTPLETQANPWNLRKIMSLLGGSMVGAFLVVLLLNITGLRKQLWPPKPSQPSDSAPASSLPPSSSSPTGELSASPAETVAPPVPDLSKPEASSANLGTVSRLQPSSSSAPTSNSSAPSTSRDTAPSTSRDTAPAPSPESVPILRNQTSQTGLFYVVIPYNNAASLQQARQLVPTAFLTNGTGGQQVQAGALETKEAAERLAKQLRSKGLSAAIIAPS